jgi:large conductance mechanosensitive channel
MLSGFRKFIMRGNVVDLAIAVVIGAAFGAIVTAVAKDLIGGLIGAVFSTKRFAAAKVTINGSDVIYGSTITALINFLIVAAVIYFVIVVPMNELHRRRTRDEEAATPAPSDETRLLTEIRDLLAARRDAVGQP